MTGGGDLREKSNWKMGKGTRGGEGRPEEGKGQLEEGEGWRREKVTG